MYITPARSFAEYIATGIKNESRRKTKTQRNVSAFVLITYEKSVERKNENFVKKIKSKQKMLGEIATKERESAAFRC